MPLYGGWTLFQVSALGGISKNRWQRYLETLGFEERLEFNEGDVGLAGGIQAVCF